MKIRISSIFTLGPFRFSHDNSRMYSVSTKDGNPQLATLDRLEDGKLKLVHTEDCQFRAGYLDVDRTGQYIAGNSYKLGKVMLWKLDEGVYRGGKLVDLDLGPRAHAANFSADNRWLLVPATEPNKVFVNRFDADTGTLVQNDPAFATGPTGEKEARQPRHLLFHPSKKDVVYSTNERDEPGVCVWRWETEKGILKPVENIVTKPDGFEGQISTATLRITADSRFLFVSNRNKEGHSSIVSFRTDPESGALKLIGHTPCESVPRTFCLDRGNKFVYVAGQLDSRLGVYVIDLTAGKLSRVEQHPIGKRPTWMEVR